MAAMCQGGMGILGDLLFGARNRMGGTLLSTVTGPAMGVAENLWDINLRLRDGDVDVLPQLLRTLWQNVPGNNLFYVSGLMQWLWLNHMYESIRPGYIRRMMRRVETENGQTFLGYPDVWGK